VNSTVFRCAVGGAYVPTFFAGMYAPLGMSTPSQHFVHAQDRAGIPEIGPATRPGPVARVPDQASFHGIVVHVIVLWFRHPNIISFLRRVHADKNRRDICAARAHHILAKAYGCSSRVMRGARLAGDRT